MNLALSAKQKSGGIRKYPFVCPHYLPDAFYTKYYLGLHPRCTGDKPSSSEEIGRSNPATTPRSDLMAKIPFNIVLIFSTSLSAWSTSVCPSCQFAMRNFCSHRTILFMTIILRKCVWRGGVLEISTDTNLPTLLEMDLRYPIHRTVSFGLALLSQVDQECIGGLTT